MRGMYPLVMCAIAGCHEHAVDVHVATDAQTSAVELFLATRVCADCAPGIGPPGTNAAIPGTVYYMDNDLRPFAKLAAGDTSVDFWLEPGTSDQVLRLVAVGFDANNQARSLAVGPGDFTISEHLGEEWRLVLAPAPKVRQAPAPLDIGTGDDVLVWRPPVDPASPTTDGHASCLMITHASTQQHEFIVPPVDADCDGVIDQECKRTIFEYAEPPDTSKLCLGPPPGIPGACRLGNPSGCVDGGGADSCKTGKYCVPDPICMQQSCLQQPFDQNCLQDLLMTTGVTNVPRLQCTIYFNAGTGLCVTSAPVDANTLFPGCLGVSFVQGTQVPIVPRSSITVPGLPTSVTLGAPHAPCTFDVAFMDSPGMAEIAVPASIVVDGASSYHAAMPVVLDFRETNDCTIAPASTCGFLPNPITTDHVWACGK